MKVLMVILLVIVSAAVLLSRKKPADGAEAPAAGPAPTALDPLKLELQNRMEEFLERDLFSLVIQPVVDFRNNTVSNGEVLSRLNHPERGTVFPDNFLPAVDALGLYPRFDRYIFRKSCAWLSRSLAQGEQFNCLSCNFSRKTLSEANIAMELTQIADSFGVPHEKLAIEITERERETDAQLFLANLQHLKASGFRIFLDDYGIGVTSVKDIMNYPLDTVKIDQSILYTANTDQGKAAYRALVAMAKELGLTVVCEGIETEEQSSFARDAGCHYGQGFLYFLPIDVDEMFEMMERSLITEVDA